MSTSTSTSRVNYFEKQYLRRQDFSDEQAYHVAQRRRHNIAHHSWGIVLGLELALEEGGAIVVRPGMAIDGYGRELVLPAKRAIEASEFIRLGSNRLDVWLFYENSLGSPAPAGYVACGDDSQSFYRTSETPRVFLERASASRVKARRPKLVSPAQLDATNQLQTTDNPLIVWPVYLGRVTYVPEDSDPAKQFLIDASDRTYAGVMAETLDHPANPARVELGKTSSQDDQRQIGDKTYTYKNGSGKRAFAVFVPPDDPGEVELAPRFQIDVDGNNYLRGTGTVYGNLQMALGGAVQFTKAAQVDDAVARLEPSLYRAAGQSADELRVDLGDITQNVRMFVIGFTAEDGSFQPSMKLEFSTPQGGTVSQPLLTVYGNIKIAGLLDSPDVLERSLTGETLKALLASFQAGSIAAGGQ